MIYKTLHKTLKKIEQIILDYFSKYCTNWALSQSQYP